MHSHSVYRPHTHTFTHCNILIQYCLHGIMLHSAAFTVAVVLLFCCPVLTAVQSMEYGAQKRKFYAHPVRSQTNIQQGYFFGE